MSSFLNVIYLDHVHSWASASRLEPPASAFRHLTFLSGTVAFRNQTMSPYSGTGFVPASAFCFIPVPDCPDAEDSGIPVFHKNEQRLKGVHYTRSYCLWRRVIHPARPYTAGGDLHKS
jgi:hypothetical protein